MLALRKNRTKTQILRMRRADPLIRWILKKIYVDRENCVIKIIGKVQKGKSTISLEIAWRLLNVLFNVKFIVFHPEQFSELYAMGVKRGDVIMYEEIGTEAGGLPRRRWYEFNNLLLLDIMQTHGFEGTVCILTLPSSKYLDSNTEPLIDIEIEARKIDRRNHVNIFTAYWVEWNEEQQKTYRHCFIDRDGTAVEVFAWKRTFPPETLQSYKDKEHEFKHWVQGRVNEEVRKKQVTKDEEQLMFDKVMSSISNFIQVRHNKTFVSQALIEMEFRVGNRVAQRLKLKAEREILSNDEFISLRESLSSNLVYREPEKKG